MAEDWTAIAAEVAGALSDVGHAGTLLRKGGFTGPEYDPTPLPDQQIPVRLLGDTMALGLIDGSTIHAGDRREMMAAEGTVPTPADRLRIGATEYAIVRAEPYAPGGVPLFFDLILRV
ncbi:hypothetical protein [Paracoccus fontiphilus]|uniref:Uncharacterized protein n=1 Tax=Paracoccus fontiphilus TaxID=1815556 RepID=A0ABV7IHG9_9RHOB|nr:hypothetical protein [Paracoccus fontiphilus]